MNVPSVPSPATTRARSRPPSNGPLTRRFPVRGVEDLVPLAHPVAPDDTVPEEGVVGRELVDRLPRREHRHGADGLVGERAHQQQLAALVELVEPARCAG